MVDLYNKSQKQNDENAAAAKNRPLIEQTMPTWAVAGASGSWRTFSPPAPKPFVTHLAGILTSTLTCLFVVLLRPSFRP